MSEPMKFHAPLWLACEVRQRALKQGRSNSDIVCQALEQVFAASPNVDSPEAVVDVVERGSHGSRAVALYLSKPIAGAVRQLAQQQQRSESWIVRDLLRAELTRRGVLPTANHEQAAEAQADSFAEFMRQRA
jgi:predicted transcriptional regulator